MIERWRDALRRVREIMGMAIRLPLSLMEREQPA
jgi:hypothetical protein